MPMQVNKIYHGDNIAVLKDFPDDCINLTITSPPYGTIRVYRGFVFDFKGLARELFRVTSPGGVIVWVCADQTFDSDRTGDSFRQVLYFKEVGFKFFDTIIFAKQNYLPMPNNCCYGQQYEFMFVFSKGKIKSFNPLMVNPKQTKQLVKFQALNVRGEKKERKNNVMVTGNLKPRSNIWYYKVGLNSFKNKRVDIKHPAPFPEELVQDHILSWCKQGDVVLDPFAGSGTTCKVAKGLGRNFVGIEYAMEYCVMICRRLTMGVGNLWQEYFVETGTGLKAGAEVEAEFH